MNRVFDVVIYLDDIECNGTHVALNYINDRPLLFHNIALLEDTGCIKNITIIGNIFQKQIQNYCMDNQYIPMCPFKTYRTLNKPLITRSWNALPDIEGPFIFMNGGALMHMDSYQLKELLDMHELFRINDIFHFTDKDFNQLEQLPNKEIEHINIRDKKDVATANCKYQIWNTI